ncbi:hypothetical protein CRYUN_Cryun25bG0053200 [Craigia yunnanensis]
MTLYKEMITKGIYPDTYTIPYVLKACTKFHALNEGQQIHAHSIKFGLNSYVYVLNTLTRIYAVCGIIPYVQKLFDESPERDLVSWTTLIQAFVKMGLAKEAIQAYFDMCRENLRPDKMTLVVVLSACSRLGDLSLGTQIHENICDIHDIYWDVFCWQRIGCYVYEVRRCGFSSGLKPESVTLVAVLNASSNLGSSSKESRAGLISEAEEFIANMPIEPDAFVWGALLGACRVHGNVELGESAMKKLVAIEPVRDGAYVLMSNIYSSANSWKDMLKLRKAIKERKVKKTPVCSLIEVHGIVHEFRKGDKSHPRNEELRKLLEEMAIHL